MTYQAFINNILNTRGRFMNDDEYYERHHIIPRCKDGSDDNDNLIDLLAREHFIAHKMLAEENADDDPLVYAYLLMAFMKDKNQQRYELSPEEYEEARKLHAKKFSGKNNPSARSVIRLKDEKVYDTIRDCCADNNTTPSAMWAMIKKCRDFMYYDEWMNLSDDERTKIKDIDWNAVQHKNRSDAAKRIGSGGSTYCRPETRIKIGLANKGKHSTIVYCPELDRTFDSIKEASSTIGINKTSIGYCLCGKQKHAGKHPVTGEKLSWVKLENKIS